MGTLKDSGNQLRRARAAVLRADKHMQSGCSAVADSSAGRLLANNIPLEAPSGKDEVQLSVDLGSSAYKLAEALLSRYRLLSLRRKLSCLAAESILFGYCSNRPKPRVHVKLSHKHRHVVSSDDVFGRSPPA